MKSSGALLVQNVGRPPQLTCLHTSSGWSRLAHKAWLTSCVAAFCGCCDCGCAGSAAVPARRRLPAEGHWWLQPVQEDVVPPQPARQELHHLQLPSAALQVG